jgi:hypothetical protein
MSRVKGSHEFCLHWKNQLFKYSSMGKARERIADGADGAWQMSQMTLVNGDVAQGLLNAAMKDTYHALYLWQRACIDKSLSVDDSLLECFHTS